MNHFFPIAVSVLIAITAQIALAGAPTTHKRFRKLAREAAIQKKLLKEQRAQHAAQAAAGTRPQNAQPKH